MGKLSRWASHLNQFGRMGLFIGQFAFNQKTVSLAEIWVTWSNLNLSIWRWSGALEVEREPPT
jgi:hypothetical protein